MRSPARRRHGTGEVPAPPSRDGTDAELLAAVAGEHVDALRLLHQRHAPWLRARLSRRCADPDAVDSAIQETFVAVWRGAAARFNPESPAAEAGGWLWTIAIRKLVSVLRSRGGRWVGQGHPAADADAVTSSAEETVLVGVEHGDLGAALARLSPELRAVIQATVLDGLTVKEAAQLLGLPEGTVKTRARRARAQLREQLA
jgi:RNA polymerase sigma-70 factor (ECF subfamily)